MISNRTVTAIILAAGNSTRFGQNRNKNFELINGKTILSYSINAFDNNKYVDNIIIVIKQDDNEKVQKIIQQKKLNKKLDIVLGGNSRQESVYNAINKAKSDIVIIHDGARPAIKQEYINTSIEEMNTFKGVTVGVKSKDTIKITDNDGIITDTTKRSNTWIIQTPQCFDREILLNLHKKYKNIEVTDDCMLLEKDGYKIKIIEGDYTNIKVTTYEDINIIREFISSKKNFIITDENVETYVQEISKWIKTCVEKAKANGVVLGMSSGVDCSTVARICQVAGVNTHLVLMPYGDDMTNSKSYADAMELINKFNFDYHVFDIKTSADNIEISEKFKNNSNKTNIELAKANIRPRMRMTYLYQYAQTNNLLVIGTGNLSERTVGYFTKWGDGACDINPIGMLTKREVYIVAKYLKVPDSIINKKPSAGLWEGQTDEAELGMTYEQIDKFILEGTSGNKEVDELIKIKKEKAMHKLNPIPIFKK